jgi:hypothetical protein
MHEVRRDSTHVLIQFQVEALVDAIRGYELSVTHSQGLGCKHSRLHNLALVPLRL